MTGAGDFDTHHLPQTDFECGDGNQQKLSETTQALVVSRLLGSDPITRGKHDVAKLCIYTTDSELKGETS